jgi:hypothetical protein
MKYESVVNELSHLRRSYLHTLQEIDLLIRGIHVVLDELQNLSIAAVFLKNV